FGLILFNFVQSVCMNSILKFVGAPPFQRLRVRRHMPTQYKTTLRPLAYHLSAHQRWLRAEIALASSSPTASVENKEKPRLVCRGRLLRNGEIDDIRLFERLRHHCLLVMPEASSKSDRRHRDDDGQSEKCSHC